MYKRRPQEAKSPVRLVGLEMQSSLRLALLGHFLAGTLMYLQSFLSALSDSPERLNFCLMDTCLAAGILEAKLGEGKGVSTFLMYVFTSRYGISNVNRICLTAPQRLSVLPSSENGLLVIGWDWERTVIQLLGVKREIRGSNCILNSLQSHHPNFIPIFSSTFQR